MITNSQIRRSSETKISALLMVSLMGIAGASGLHAQSNFWQLNPAVPPSWVDDETFHGKTMISTGQMLVLSFKADGSGGYLQIGENFSDSSPVVPSPAAANMFPSATI